MINDRQISKRIWLVTPVTLAIVGLCIILLVHPYLRPTPLAADEASEQKFVQLVQATALLYFTAWGIQMIFGGPFAGLRSALNTLAIVAAMVMLCWAVLGDQAAYEAICESYAAMDATSQLIFLCLVFASIMAGLIWLAVSLFRLSFRVGWQCRDFYERWGS